MKSKSTKIKRTEAQAVKTRLMQHALNHLEEIDGRTGTILLKNGLLNNDSPVLEDDYVLEVLSNPTHPERISISLGPIVAYYIKGNKSEASVVEVATLLLSRDKRARNEAFYHFQKIIKSCGHLKPERLESLLRENKDALLCDEIEKWTGSSIILFDAFNDDFFLNLTAFKQCIELNYNPGLNQYFPKLLNPSLASVEWIELPVAIPSKQYDQVKEIIKNAVSQSSSFAEACNFYYHRLGTVPLTKAFALTAVLDEWIALERDTHNLWQQVWAWADETLSPLARYHAAQLFSHYISFVPDQGVEHLWNEISGIITSSITKDLETRWSQEWRLRCDLAQHYIKYFESRRPERNSEAIARFAWWLSEQVSLVFANQTKLIEVVRASGVKAALIKSNYAWQTINPPMEMSVIRFATIFINSIWSLSLECQIGERLEAMKYPKVDSQRRRLFEQAVGESLSCWFPPKLTSGEIEIYAFDSGLDGIANAVGKNIENPNSAQVFRNLIARREVFEKNERITLSLKEVLEIDQVDQTLLAYAFRFRSNLNAIPIEEIWKIIINEKWNRPVLLSLDATILQILFESLNTLQLRGGDLWRCNFPHMLANIAEQAHENPERQNILFLFTIISSISGDTVSAIERLLKGKHRNDFAEDVKLWRNQFSRIIQLSPAWAAARIRPAVASLSLT